VGLAGTPQAEQRAKEEANMQQLDAIESSTSAASMRVLDLGGSHVFVERGLWESMVRQHKPLLRVVAGPLTARELEVLALVAQGKGNKEIAITLGISKQTVKNHLTEIMERLNAADRAECVAIALRQGLIE
jgi:DNA-binding NarL/FixJ family response regulator